MAGATVCVVGLSALARLLTTTAIFALAWPVFTQMRNWHNWCHHLENPNLYDHTVLAWHTFGSAVL
ncbi:hypothetical protein [Streptomyces murinus]|uniref:hypothetical protein n=1 Tax=Streptomyces murinus TaxID=33900 RepID=UPI00380A4BB4